ATDDPNIGDWTKDNTKTQEYDTWKVEAVLNEIKGFDHSGRSKVGTPAIFGLNFQTVSTAEKLNTSLTPQSLNRTQLGGYEADSSGALIPGPVLRSALNFIDEKLNEIVQNIDSNTILIVSAKHGQSPQNRKNLLRIDDGTILDALNAAWKSSNPNAP